MDNSIIRKSAGSPNSPWTLTLESEILGERRNVYIQLPEGYEQVSKAYPVLCVLDGEWLFEIVRANLRFYSEYEVMGPVLPQMIVVGIENVDRDRDYVPTPDPHEPPMFKTAGKADLFAEFLSKELFPIIEQSYRALPNRTVVGWSFSGLFALYSAIQHQDLFDAFLCIGPAIWWDDRLVAKLIEEYPLKKRKRVVIACGSAENGGDVYESVHNLLKMLEERPNNLDVDYIEIAGVGHSWGIPEAVDRGLKQLFNNYLPSEEFSALNLLDEYYVRLSDIWGFEVLPPDSQMIELANKLWASDEKEAALTVLEKLLAFSQNCSMGLYFQGRYLALRGQTSEALAAYHAAINAELARPVPNLVYAQAYRDKFEKLLVS